MKKNKEYAQSNINDNLKLFVEIPNSHYPKWTCYGTWAIFVILTAGLLLNCIAMDMATTVMSIVPIKEVRK